MFVNKNVSVQVLTAFVFVVLIVISTAAFSPATFVKISAAIFEPKSAQNVESGSTTLLFDEISTEPEKSATFENRNVMAVSSIFNNILDPYDSHIAPTVGPISGYQYRFAQPFTPESSGYARIVSLWTLCISNGNYCLGQGDATIEFQGDNGGKPNGVSLGTATISSPVSSGSSPGCSATVGQPYLTAGTQYWAVLSSTTQIAWLGQPVPTGTVRPHIYYSIDGGTWTNYGQGPLSLRIEDDPTCQSQALPMPTPGTSINNMIVRPTTKDAGTVSIGSIGTASLVITGGNFTGGDASRFSVLQTPPYPEVNAQNLKTPKVIGYGGSTIIYAVCTGGETEGVYNSTLNITTNDPSNPTLSWPVRCLNDQTPPTVHYTVTPNGSNGWFKTKLANVYVYTLDPESGGLVKNVTCKLDGNEFVNVSAGSANAIVNVEGIHTISCIATDAANNVSNAVTQEIKIDSVAPTINGVRNPAANSSGWNSTDMDVTFGCTDAAPSSEFDINTVVTTPIHFTNETAISFANSSGTCRDLAGNTAFAVSVSVKIDKTKPVISSSISPAANAAGWQKSDVTVNFTCADVGSVKSGVIGTFQSTKTLSVSTPAAGTTVFNNGTCIDDASNIANTASATVKLDKDPPDTTITSSPNLTSSVKDASFTFNGADSPSGLSSFECKLDGGNFAACSGAVNYSGLSLGSHNFQVRAIDIAGNTDPTPATFSWIVDLYDTTTVLTANPANSVDQSNDATFTATVSSANGIPSGTVTFVDSITSIAIPNCGSVPLVAGSSNARAICTSSTLAVSPPNHTITASYSGSDNHDPSSGTVANYIVNPCTSNPVVTSAAGDDAVGTLRFALSHVCDAPNNHIKFNIGNTSPDIINLSNGSVNISRDAIIGNPDVSSFGTVTIRGDGSSHILRVDSGRTASISDLNLTNGNGGQIGGAIQNDGTLTLTGMAIYGNISDSSGGGIRNNGALTIYNSTVSSNSSKTDGGGIFNTAGKTLTLINVTVTNNKADSDNTGDGTGGGIRNAGTASIKNSIVAGNFAGAANAENNVSGTVGTSVNNLLAGNPMLAALANNGGPTQTNALLPGSPAQDAGNNAAATAAGLTTDQRGSGFPRVVNSIADIGAYEANYAISATFGSGQSTIVGSPAAMALKATVTNNGTPVSGVSVIFTAPASGASGTFPGNLLSAVVTSDALGVATLPAFTANGLVGSFTVSAASPGYVGTANFSMTNLAASPSISTNASPSVPLGVPILDTATISGGVNPGGSITFRLYGPDDSECSNTPVFISAPVTVSGNGTYPSEIFAPTTAGIYRWRAFYSGDANNNSTSGVCGAANESVTIQMTGPTITTIASAGVTVGSGGKISDSATLAGGYNPTGSITFRLYGPNDPGCNTTAIFTSDAVSVSGNGTYGSENYLPTAAGTYLWRAFYSGDINNHSVSGVCGAAGETVQVDKAAPTVTTTASPGVTVGSGSNISDSAVIASGFQPAGSITFKLYGPNDAACTHAPAFTSAAIAVNGNGTYGSGDYSPSAAGTYLWVASYSGDANNNAVAGTCGATGETVEVEKATPQMTTTASSGVVLGQSVSDSIVLANGYNPTGFINFRLTGPDDDTCSDVIYTPPPVTVTGNGTYSSGNFTPQAAGTYRWVAVYSGDANNKNVLAACGSPNQSVIVGKTNTEFTSIADTPDPTAIDQSYTVSFTVAAVAPGSGVPRGTVEVTDGTGDTCTGTLSNGSGSCTMHSPTQGVKTLTYKYNGNSDFGGTTNNSTTHTVSCTPNLVVTNTNDSGPGSLRKATTDTCSAGGQNSITFAPGLFSAPQPAANEDAIVAMSPTIITLASEMVIGGNINIVGPGADKLIISGNNNSRIYSVGSGAVLNISGVTLTGGNGAGAADNGYGGAILNNGGTLGISSCILTGNTATSGSGALLQGSSAESTTIKDSTFSNNTTGGSGGAIRAVSGTLNIVNSTFSNNSSTSNAGTGGAIDSSAALNIINSTFSGNSVPNGTSMSGGALLVNGFGMVTISNSTITSNSVGGGTAAGGIFKTAGGESATNVRSTILAGNINNSTVPDASGVFSSGGFNLIGNIGNATGFTQSTDQKGNGASPLNPRLLPLANNEGPTQTHVLCFGTGVPSAGCSGLSPAIDKGKNFATDPSNGNAPLLTDQRGKTRPIDMPESQFPNPLGGDGTDIGAFEALNSPPAISPVAILRTEGEAVLNSTIANVVDAENGNGDVSVSVFDGSIYTTTATIGGVTISNILNLNGVITANVVAACGTSASPPARQFTLRATDGGGLVSDGTLSVTVVANPAPLLTYPSPQNFVFGQTGVVSPTAASDNVAITGFSVYSVVPELQTAPTVDSAGNVTVTNAMPWGNHVITIRATDTCGKTTNSSFSLAVNKAETNVSLASSQNPSVFGQEVTFTATATAVSPGSGTPAGTITFKDGSTIIGTANLNGSGVATFSRSSLSVGNHTISADYNGDTNFNAKTGTLPGNPQVVTKADSNILLTSSPNPSVFGQAVTLTAAVTAVLPGAGYPAGTITFKDGEISIGTGTLNAAGIATLSTSALAVSSHPLTATYNGDGNFNPGSGLVSGNSHTVNKAETALTIATDPNPVVWGQAVTITANIKVVDPGAGMPSGTVEFSDGNTLIAGCETVPLNASGSTICSTATLGVGTHNIAAAYGGNGSFNGSRSIFFSQNGNKASTTTTIGSSVNSSTFGQSATYTATVAVIAPGAGIPTGTVNFFDGATPIAACQNVTLTAGLQVQCSTASLTAGVHALTATYFGDGNFNGSTGNVTQTVNNATTATVVTTSGTFTVTGQGATFVSAVTAIAPGVGIPAGTVNFSDGATPIAGCQNIVLSGAGIAQCGTSTLTAAASQHIIKAIYSGGTNFNASEGAVAQTINKADTTTALATSVNPVPTGQNVTFTAAVTALAPGIGIPAGSVSFQDGGTTIAGCESTALNSSAVATCTTSSLAAGSRVITAAYSGNSGFNISTGNLTGNPQIVDSPPTASATASDVTVQGGTKQSVTVVYTDNNAVNVATLDSNDIRVTGPNGFDSPVTFVNVNNNTNGTPRTAAYTFTAPGGTWDATDNGVYAIVMQDNMVSDLFPQAVVGGTIGTFTVSICNPVVTTLANAGTGSLREAVTNACNGSVITFAPNLAGTITLTTGEIAIPTNLTIQGPGANVITVSGNNAGRVFSITPGLDVKINDLTVTGGRGDFGGGIFHLNAALSLRRVVIAGNTATASGGGVYNNAGSLSITESTIASNTGGGIVNSGTLVMINTTVSGNTAGAGVANLAGTAQLTSDTITNNTSGVSNSGGGTFTVQNTIVAGNTSNADAAGSYISGGYNLVGNAANSTGFNQAGDQTGSANSPANPQLAPLSSNGGPTPTHAFSSTLSPAIDKGRSFNLATDQRGSARPVDFPTVSPAVGGDNSDIGAYEAGVTAGGAGADGDINRTSPTASNSSDGVVDLKDLQWYDNFVNGTFIPDSGGPAQPLTVGPSTQENQRRDVAPTNIAGDGCLNAQDRQQMVLFALSLANPGNIGGPSLLNQCPQVRPGQLPVGSGSSQNRLPETTPAGKKTPSGDPGERAANTPEVGSDAQIFSADDRKRRATIDSSITRAIRVISSEVENGELLVTIEMDAAGDETKAIFGLSFDPAQLSFDNTSFPETNESVTLGDETPEGTVTAVNAQTAATGQITLYLDFNGPIPTGTQRRLANFRFRLIGGLQKTQVSLVRESIQIINGAGTELKIRIER